MSPAVVVVGTGLAGLWTTWRLANLGRPSVLLTKGGLCDSASAWAQGGIAAALGEDDSPDLHAADTVEAARGGADPHAVHVLTREGPERVRDLAALGVPFDHDPTGALRLGLEGGHSRPRIVHAGGDRSGAAIVTRLIELVRRHPLVQVREATEAQRLLCSSGRVVGLATIDPTGEPEVLEARAVVLATGGLGQLYAITTNPAGATGDGIALAHEVGAELRDLDLMQFHPTALKLPGADPAPLISEAVRGAGAHLVDAHGHRFALDADPRGELAPRDVVARAVAGADAAGGAWLDARCVTDFGRRFPGITQMLGRHGLDPRTDLIPVAPAQHYAMGGVRTDLDGRTTRPGLWAVGEVASTGVHGANRLASNSLLEALVFADRAARALAAEPPPPASDRLEPQPPTPITRSGDADPAASEIRRRMRQILTAYVGLDRTAVSLAQARDELARLARAAPADAWRTGRQLLVARLVAVDKGVSGERAGRVLRHAYF
jgi:L-aspartate oxidase